MNENLDATAMNEVLVNAAEWPGPGAPAIPPGWVIGNAPRPITGGLLDDRQLTWVGAYRHGIHYAAAPSIPPGPFGWLADDAWIVRPITDDEILVTVTGKVRDHGYADLAAAAADGITVGEVAEGMGLPWKGTA